MNATSTGLNWAAIISAIVSIGSLTSIALGHPAIAAVIDDPATAQNATAAIGAVSALVSAFSGPVHAAVTHVAPVVTSAPKAL